MRKALFILILSGIVGGFALALENRNAVYNPAAAPAPEIALQAVEPAPAKKKIDLAADVVFPYQINNDSSVICFVGNFIGHHNGAVIVCDSAVRYSDQRLECFGNVAINKNSTYIYGDRADYNGLLNEAQVYSPIVKVVDGDATLYTYHFRFNTKQNIGEFYDGGVIINRDNLLESERGYYYADTREVIGVERVEMRNDTYEMTGDSVIYNIETDNARFFTRTNIWNEKGEYLYADRGTYNKDKDLYTITLNGYILTEKNEVWSDSLDYYRQDGYALLRSNIQIDDTDHKTLAFGDWGEYWDEPGDAILTRKPEIVNYDPEQSDSLFMRADTITLHTRSTLRDKAEREAEAKESADANTPAGATGNVPAPATPAERDTSTDTTTPATSSTDEDNASDPTSRNALTNNRRDRAGKRDMADGISSRGDSDSNNDSDSDSNNSDNNEQDNQDSDTETIAVADSIQIEDNTPDILQSPADSLQLNGADSLQMSLQDSIAMLPKAERKAKLREIALKEREEKRLITAERKRVKQQELKAKLDSIGELRRERRNLQLERQQARYKEREERRKAKMLARLTRKGIKVQPLDEAAMAYIDSLVWSDYRYRDSLLDCQLDSIMLLLHGTDTLDITEPVSMEVDTLYRLVRGYRNVRIYRSDFQAICDSTASSSLDSVIHLYINPIMWHEDNQVTSEQTDIHTKNKAVDFAEFTGKPLMISKIDTLHYNQVAGKTMYSYFRDNNIYRDDVDGNAQTIYYMQEDDSPEVQGLMYIESADMTFYIEDKQVTGITYRGNPTYTLYPMDKIPESQPLFLQGFSWQEEKRPLQDSVFTRTVRPSQREQKEALPRPGFPITERMDSHRMMLIERRRWADRDDTLTADVIEWLDANTDWREQNKRSEAQRRQRMGR
ncbi:MAG: hypothetical protein J1E33_05420 [Alistipes sp.]|nr:hypothetical protein [Alistipes sp.]